MNPLGQPPKFPPPRDEFFARTPKPHGIHLPFLDHASNGHDLLVLNQHPDLIDQAAPEQALTVFNVDFP